MDQTHKTMTRTVAMKLHRLADFLKNSYRKTLSYLERRRVHRVYHEWLYPNMLPTTARIDASTICQLRCEGCGFQKSNHRQLGGGFLTFDNFKTFIDANPQLERVKLSNYGEVLLNPEIIDIIKYAFEKNVALEASMGMNFNTVTDEQIRALVDYQFRFISLSIDGGSQETYSKYRIGGDFDAVIENVRKLQAYKKQQGSEYPKLRWQYVLTQYNEMDIEKAKALADELDIPMFFRLNFMRTYQPENETYLREQTGLDCLTREEYAAKHQEPYAIDRDCNQLFEDPQINWDGRLLGCCKNEFGFDANVFTDDLIEALRSPNYVKAKEFLLMKRPDTSKYQGLPCLRCQVWKTRQRFGKALELPVKPDKPRVR